MPTPGSGTKRGVGDRLRVAFQGKQSPGGGWGVKGGCPLGWLLLEDPGGPNLVLFKPIFQTPRAKLKPGEGVQSLRKGMDAPAQLATPPL